MTTQPRYALYDSTPKPFSIGLSALDPDQWIEPDDDLEVFLAEKDHLAQTHFDEIFYSEATSIAAQQECLDLIVDHLLARHADCYRRSGNGIEFMQRSVDLEDPGGTPIQKAAALVQDDLVILEKRDAGWHITAAHLAFPSGWSLRRLPNTGAVVFTIRIYNDPIAMLTSLSDGGHMAEALAGKLMEFSPEQLAYKGMVSKRDALVGYLRERASTAVI